MEYFLNKHEHKYDFIVTVAQWKKLTAKTIKTRERFRSYELNSQESSTIPGIELYDIIDGNLILFSYFV